MEAAAGAVAAAEAALPTCSCRSCAPAAGEGGRAGLQARGSSPVCPAACAPGPELAGFLGLKC